MPGPQTGRLFRVATEIGDDTAEFWDDFIDATVEEVGLSLARHAAFQEYLVVQHGNEQAGEGGPSPREDPEQSR